MSKKKFENPYREGSAYFKGFEALRKAGNKGISKEQLAEQAGITIHDAQVVISPKAEGASRGDCRGNMSAQGHLYYTEARVPKLEKGQKKTKGRQKMVYVFRVRKEPMEPFRRAPKAKELPAQKTPAPAAEQAEQQEQVEA